MTGTTEAGSTTKITRKVLESLCKEELVEFASFIKKLKFQRADGRIGWNRVGELPPVVNTLVHGYVHPGRFEPTSPVRLARPLNLAAMSDLRSGV